MATAHRANDSEQGIAETDHVFEMTMTVILGEPHHSRDAMFDERAREIERIDGADLPRYRVSLAVEPGDRFEIDGDEYRYRGTAVLGSRLAFEPVDDGPTDFDADVRTLHAEKFRRAFISAGETPHIRRLAPGLAERLRGALPL